MYTTMLFLFMTQIEVGWVYGYDKRDRLLVRTYFIKLPFGREVWNAYRLLVRKYL
jgi:hypothetical protein